MNVLGVIVFTVMFAATVVMYSQIALPQLMTAQIFKQSSLTPKLKTPQRVARYRIARTC